MSGSVEFAFSLIDKASGPANKIAEALGGASDGLEKLDAASGNTSKLTKAVQVLTIALRTLQIAGAGVELFKALGGSGQKLAEIWAKAKEKMAAFGRGAGAAAKQAAPFVAAGGGVALIGKGLMMAGPPAAGLALGLTAIAAAAVAAGVAVAALGAKLFLTLGKAVGEAALFREKMIFAFNIQRGGAGGLAQFERIKDLAREMGAPLEDTMGFFNKMQNLKFPEKQAKDLFLRFQDLKVAAGLTQEQLNGALLQMLQMKTKGKLQGEELTVMAENGIDLNEIYKALGKRLGKTKDELLKMQQAGKLGSEDAIAAIQEAMGAMSGGKAAGQVAKEFKANTLGGIIDSIKAMGPILLDDIAAAAGPAFAILKPLADDALSFLQGDDAKAMMKEVGAAFVMVADAVKLAAPFVKEFFKGFASGLGQGWEDLKKAGGMIKETFGDVDVAATLKEWGPEIRATGEGIAKMVMGFVLLGIAIGGMLAAATTFAVWLAGLPFRIADVAVELLAAGARLGADIITGIRNGITSGLTLVTDAIRNVATSALAAAKSALGIASPSKEFAWIGKQTALGMAVGANDNAFAAHEAMANVAAPPAPTATASAIRGGMTVNLTINVHVTGGDPQQVAEAAERGAREGLESVMEQLAREVAA